MTAVSRGSLRLASHWMRGSGRFLCDVLTIVTKPYTPANITTPTLYSYDVRTETTAFESFRLGALIFISLLVYSLFNNVSFVNKTRPL
jgi:hypothetical protein